MPKNRRKLLSLLVVLAALLTAGCTAQGGQKTLSLYDAPTHVYEHPQIGVVLTVPETWPILSEDEDSVVFMEPDGLLTLTLAWELGGYTYYSDSDLLDMGESVAGQILQQPEILQRVSRSLPGNNQLVTAVGALLPAEGEVYDKAETEPANAVCEVMIFSPLPALRYYVITVADISGYEQYAGLLRDVYASFYLNESEDTLYAGLHQDDDAETADETDSETDIDVQAEDEQPAEE